MSWQALHAVSDSLTPGMIRALMAAFAKGQKRVPVSALADAIKRGLLTPVEIERLVNAIPQLVRQATAGSIADAAAGGALTEQADLRALRLAMDFETVNPLAVQAAKNQSSRLVTLITQQSRAAIQSIVSTAIQSGISPVNTARLIKTVVGLNAPQAMAVLNYRGRLTAAGAPSAQVDAMVNRYAAKLLRERSITIARTELIDSATRGQQAVWAQAQAKGILPATLEQEWIVTPDDRLCPQCASMVGSRAPIGGTFSTPYGQKTGPTMHPRCRCAVRLMRLRKQLAMYAKSLQIAPDVVAQAAAAAEATAAKAAKAAKASAAAKLAAATKKANAAKAIADAKAAAQKVIDDALAAAKAAQDAKDLAIKQAADAKKTKLSDAAKKAAATKAAKKAAMSPTAQRLAAEYGKALDTQPDLPWPIDNNVVRRLGRRTPYDMSDRAKMWVDELSYDETRAFESYTGSGYTEINGALRGISPLAGTTKKRADEIATALKRHPKPPPPALVWRGSGARTGEKLSKLKPGDVIEFDGFQSTTIDPSRAEVFGKTIMEIRPNSGAYVRPVSGIKSEQEFLLPHRARYRLVSRTLVDLEGLGKRWVYQLEMVP